uniref:Citramalyl-CoA lyase, mitochondrial n=1 Tax=Hirondellea gigas TaxID=1518452 RepID=A0A2P2IEL8_9CRUS
MSSRIICMGLSGGGRGLLTKQLQGYYTTTAAGGAMRCSCYLSTTSRRRGSAANREQEPGSSKIAFIPRRAVLYVPGSDKRKLAKIPSLAADCVVLDCEDGVAISQKTAARETIKSTLESGAVSFAGKDCSVRVNSVSSGLCSDDLSVVLSSSTLPQTLHLPKVETTEELDWFTEEVSRSLKGRELSQPLRLILFCESGRSLLSLSTLCSHAKMLCDQQGQLVLDGVVFGSDDFCADIGMTRSNEATELLFARQQFVTIVKTHRLQAIDIVYIDYKDLEGLSKQCNEGASFGFTGKQVIHPGQVPVVQRAFSPSAEKIAWATELLRDFQHHQEQGKGAFTFRGAMIDMPLVLQARNIVAMTSAQQKPGE